MMEFFRQTGRQGIFGWVGWGGDRQWTGMEWGQGSGGSSIIWDRLNSPAAWRGPDTLPGTKINIHSTDMYHHHLLSSSLLLTYRPFYELPWLFSISVGRHTGQGQDPDGVAISSSWDIAEDWVGWVRQAVADCPKKKPSIQHAARKTLPTTFVTCFASQLPWTFNTSGVVVARRPWRVPTVAAARACWQAFNYWYSLIPTHTTAHLLASPCAPLLLLPTHLPGKTGLPPRLYSLQTAAWRMPARQHTGCACRLFSLPTAANDLYSYLAAYGQHAR